MTNTNNRLRWFRPEFLAAIGAIFATIALVQAIGFPFISDDHAYIIDNAKLSGLAWTELWRLFVEPHNPYEFLPLRDLSYWIDLSLFGASPAAFKLHSLILYLLCLPLVYALSARLWTYFRPGESGDSAWVAAAVTVLFAINPAHVEAVVWASGRKDVLSGLFVLLAFWLGVQANRQGGISARYAVMSILAVLAAILSKGTAIVAAPAIALLWLVFWKEMPQAQRSLRHLAWPVAIVLLAAGGAAVFMSSSTIREPTVYGLPMLTRALTVAGELVRLAVTPEQRHFLYPGLDDPYQGIMIVLGAAVVIAGVAGAAGLIRRTALSAYLPPVLLLFCLPYFQLIPYRTVSLVADRFVFLVVWPVSMLIVLFVWKFRPQVRIAVLAVLVLAWGWQMADRPRDWKNEFYLVEKDNLSQPGYYMPAYQKIMWDQLKRNQVEAARVTAGTISDADIRDCIIRQIDSQSAVNAVAAGSGSPSQAMSGLKEFEAALNKISARAAENPSVRYIYKYARESLVNQWKFLALNFPGDVAIRYNAGLRILFVGQDYAAAADHLRFAAESRLLPEAVRGRAYKELGLALSSAGRLDEAEQALLASTKETPPDLQSWCLLENLYRQSGNEAKSSRAGMECRSSNRNAMRAQ